MGSMSCGYGGPGVVSAPSQTSGQGNVTSRAPSPYSVGPRTRVVWAVPWGEPLYRNDSMHSLERVDRVHMQGWGGLSIVLGIPRAQGYSYTSVGQSQYGRPVEQVPA